MSGKGKPKKTQEQFEKEVYDLYQEEYTVLGKYINANEYIKMRHNCDECNSHEYDVKPTQFLKGKYKCPICFRTSKKTTEKYKKEVYNKYGDEYEVIGEYTGSNKYIQIRHCCGKEYPVLANALLQGNRCPVCGSASRVLNKTKTHEEFCKEVYDLEGDEYIVKSDYIGAKEDISMFHIICSTEYSTTPDRFLHRARCPKCNQSKGETKIDEVLTNINFTHDREFTFIDLKGINGGLLRFDVPIFWDSEKTQLAGLIEFDGEQHFRWIKGMMSKKDFKKLQYHDKLKDKYCVENNIKLLRIKYDQFDDIEKLVINFIQELSDTQTDSSILIAK